MLEDGLLISVTIKDATKYHVLPSTEYIEKSNQLAKLAHTQYSLLQKKRDLEAVLVYSYIDIVTCAV